MASTSKEITKDHELLIRIDERLLALVNRMTSIEQMMKDHQQQSDNNKIKIAKGSSYINKIDNGNNNKIYSAIKEKKIIEL